jgi:hypothetical protein
LIRGGFSLVVACASIAALTGPAFAQVAGGGDSRDRLNIQMSLAEAYDSRVAEGLPSLLPEGNLQGSGLSTILSGAANYAGTLRDVGLTALASTYVRNNDQFNRFAMGSQNARVGASFALPKRSTFVASQSAAYSPSYLDQLFPGDAEPAPGEGLPVNAEYQTSRGGSYSYATSMTLSKGRQIGTRFAATAEYGYRDVREESATRPNVTTYGIGARLSHAPSRRRSFSVGYRYRTGEFGSDGLTVGHEVTLGTEYSRPLSVSRRLTFRLGITPTLLDIPASALNSNGGEAVAGQRMYPVQFDGSVEYPFHLRWSASVGYVRSVSYLAGLNEPTISDSARARLTGVLGRRANVSFMARYAASGSTLSGDPTSLGTYTGEARFGFALGRSFSVYTQYLYSYYEDEAVGRPSLVSRGAYAQHGIRVGITVFTQPFGG